MELLFLHALPLDGAMWAGQAQILPGASHWPTLYPFGNSVEDWAAAALDLVTSDRLLVVGCSVGGSCALELAALATDRVAALVLIGTKADHRPEPALHAAALDMLRDEGLDAAWDAYWAPLFARSADSRVVGEARRMMLRHSPLEIARGVTAFHSRPSRGALLPALPCPVVFVTGAEDVAPGPATIAAQAGSSPRGRLHVIPHCGHYVPLERPDQLNAILRELIDALG